MISKAVSKVAECVAGMFRNFAGASGIDQLAVMFLAWLFAVLTYMMLYMAITPTDRVQCPSCQYRFEVYRVIDERDRKAQVYTIPAKLDTGR